MAEEQRLRWWQDEELNQAAREAPEREEELDSWTEWEAEALGRLQPRTESEAVSFYTDKAKSAQMFDLRRNMLASVQLVSASLCSVLLFQAVLVWKMPECRDYILSPFGLSPYIGILLLYALTLPLTITDNLRHRKWLQNLTKPAVQLTPQAIYLHTRRQPNILLRWNEILSITPKCEGKYHFLELCCTEDRRFAIYDWYLPVTIEALAAHVAIYKAAREID